MSYGKNKMEFDTLIKNAMIYEGDGSTPFVADLAIKGNRIVSIGPRLDLRANVVIDAAGMALSPGFIDTHSHDDFAVICHSDMDFKVMQGVTTDIVGNCGLGPAPFKASKNFWKTVHSVSDLPECETYKEYSEILENIPSSLNVAFLVGHGTMRRAVMGDADRKASPEELKQMFAILNEGMAAGAVGFSTGLVYIPGRYSDTEELIAIAKEMAKSGGGLYATHMRDEGDKMLDSIHESLNIGKSAGVPVHISHHKVHGVENWGLVHQSLALIEKARKEGFDITVDQYPYTAASTFLSALVIQGAIKKFLPKDFLICSAPHMVECVGKTLADLSIEWGINPEEAADRIVQNGDAIVALTSMNEEDVRFVMKHHVTMIGSDGIPSDEGNPHPRLYGTFPRVLGYYGRDNKLFKMEEAIHKMTGLPATKFKIRDRGFVRANYYADLVLFKPEKIMDTATYLDSRQYPVGIEHVFVNGTAVVKNGQHTHAHPGMVLKRTEMNRRL